MATISKSSTYLTSEEVEDIHRNSDLNKSFDSQHHSLGMDQYKASRGDHIHDGSTGVALMENDSISGVLTNATQLPFIVKSLLTILADRFGLQDNTTT